MGFESHHFLTGPILWDGDAFVLGSEELGLVGVEFML